MRRLTEKMIKAGEDLVRVLHESRFPLQAALWVYFSELEDWRMYLAIPGVRAEGRIKFYRRIFSLTRNEYKFPVEFHLGLLDAKDIVAKLLGKPVKAGDLANYRYLHGSIRGKYFDDVHIYPLPEDSRRRRRKASSVG